MMTGPKKSKRAANTLDVKSLSFVPGSGVPGGCGTRKSLNKPDNQREKEWQTYDSGLMIIIC